MIYGSNGEAICLEVPFPGVLFDELSHQEHMMDKHVAAELRPSKHTTCTDTEGWTPLPEDQLDVWMEHQIEKKIDYEHPSLGQHLEQNDDVPPKTEWVDQYLGMEQQHHAPNQDERTEKDVLLEPEKTKDSEQLMSQRSMFPEHKGEVPSSPHKALQSPAASSSQENASPREDSPALSTKLTSPPIFLRSHFHTALGHATSAMNSSNQMIKAVGMEILSYAQNITSSLDCYLDPVKQKGQRLLRSGKSWILAKTQTGVMRVRTVARHALVDLSIVKPKNAQEHKEKTQRRRERKQRSEMRKRRRGGSKIINEIERFEEARLLYKMLGVKKTATLAQLKSAYRRRSLRVHPDKNPDPRAALAFDALRDAYDLLRDEQNRHHYDQELRLIEAQIKLEKMQSRAMLFQRVQTISQILEKNIWLVVFGLVAAFFFFI
mmetsp:Transcript_40684/g.70127  ORF Transcript_40684/g.70127 Transcript_40684/m.70127 type:complete len:433 (+) Transcript_40684:275-1573(+)